MPVSCAKYFSGTLTIHRDDSLYKDMPPVSRADGYHVTGFLLLRDEEPQGESVPILILWTKAMLRF